MNEEKKAQINNIKNILPILLFCISAVFGYFLLGEDLTIVIRWWAVLIFLGILVLPLTVLCFQQFADAGYLFGKVIGLCAAGFLMWLFSSIKVFPFTTKFCILSCFILLAVIWGIFLLILHVEKDKKRAVLKLCEEKWMQMIKSEIFFFIVLILFTYLLGNKVVGTETEKSMDLAFMNVINQTSYFPPMDSWASGTVLNYYYFGQYLFTFLSKISFCGVRFGYNLAISTLAAFCFTLVYYIGYESMRFKAGQSKTKYAAGIFSAVFVTLAGNMHYFIFAKIVPMLWEILQLPGEKPSYWFAESTRYIGYIPNIEGDKTISEFPAYSFLIGDLHAHVIDIMIVLTIVALCLHLFLYGSENKSKSIILRFMKPQLLMTAFLIGICSMTNYWDFPIYFVVTGSIVLFYYLRQESSKKRAVIMTLLQGVFILVLSSFIALPFSLHFDKMVMGISICKVHSKFYQLVILWGFPIWLVLSFVRQKLWTETKESADKNIQIQDIFIILISLCAIGLVLLPECIYVKDIYEAGFPRANTMFKLTYEAFILFGIAAGYVIAEYLFCAHNRSVRKKGIIGLLCLCLTTGYFFSAAKMWLGNYLQKDNYKGIDAEAYYQEKLPDDYQAIEWMRQNITGNPVVLQADGDSYTDYNVVSTLTGFATPLGWHTHEWLWKNSYDFMLQRQEAVTDIYTCSEEKTVRRLLKEYQIDYIYIGSSEYEKYGEMQTELLKKLGNTVYSKWSDAGACDIMIIQITGTMDETE